MNILVRSRQSDDDLELSEYAYRGAARLAQACEKVATKAAGVLIKRGPRKRHNLGIRGETDSVLMRLQND